MSAIPNDRPALKRQPVQETLLKVVGWCILSEQSGFKCCLNVQVLTSLFFLPRFLLMMGVLFCCGAGFFIRRRMYPPPLVEEPTFNVSYTRQPVNTASGQRLLIPVPLVPYFGQGLVLSFCFVGFWKLCNLYKGLHCTKTCSHLLQWVMSSAFPTT